MFSQVSSRNSPKSRVELHIHFTSAVRCETVWELRRHKGLPLPGGGSLHDLKKLLVVPEAKNLDYYLSHKDVVESTLAGDLEAIQRVGYEMAEDQAREGVLYTEVRLILRSLLPAPPKVRDGDGKEDEVAVTVDTILLAALRGIRRGEKHFGTKIRILLSCVRSRPEWSWETLRLCEKYRDAGLVGLDLAGSEGQLTEDVALVRNPVLQEVFREAAAKGIHRTVHSGEAGPASCVRYAVEVLGAERIGHGYRVLEDEEVFNLCLKRGVHFEVCLNSSLLSGALLNATSSRHPVLRYIESEASFSLSTDNPTIINSCLTKEYQLAASLGLTEADLTRANFQAALHAFLPPDEKAELIAKLKEAYGIPNLASPSCDTPAQPPRDVPRATLYEQ